MTGLRPPQLIVIEEHDNPPRSTETFCDIRAPTMSLCKSICSLKQHVSISRCVNMLS